MNRDTVSNTHYISLQHWTLDVCIDFPPLLQWTCSVCWCVSKTTCPTLDCPQISKELINFYDSAYIKAVDVSGSPSKDSAIKVLDAFHTTVWLSWKPFTSLDSDMELSWTSCFVMCIGDRNLFWSCVYLSSYSWSPLQLDCCGKGDDTPLFKQVAGTLCPRKSPEDFLKSQVYTEFTMDSIPV